MKFLFNMFNHNPVGQRSLEDVLGIFGKQLMAMGHHAVWDTSNDNVYTADHGWNVIVEGFNPSICRKIAELHGKGARFICLATEEPTPTGFNHGRDPEMAARQRDFPEAAKYFDGILHLVPGQHVTDWYSQFAPSAYVELGYAASLMRRPDLMRTEPEFDFGFYGSLSERRLKILRKLAKVSRRDKAVKIVADFKTQNERDAEMRRCKVVVQIRKFEEMGLVSSSRCCTSLFLGRPVVAEPHELSKPWDEIVRFSETLDGFYSSAMMVRSAWRGVYQEQLEKFKAKLPPEVCVGEPLRKIGIAP